MFVGSLLTLVLVGSSSDCPSTGIKYLPKSGSPAPTMTTTTTTAPTGTTAPGTPFSGKGYLQVTEGGANNGCIISGGTWYIGGTCATFTATASGTGFTLTSSKGNCAVQSTNLVCSSSVTTATVFTVSLSSRLPRTSADTLLSDLWQ